MDAFLTAFANSEERKALDNSLVLDGKMAGKSVISVIDAIEVFKQWLSSRKIWLEEQISQLEGSELGDVNCDGIVDKADLNLMIDYLMDKTPEDTFDVNKADVNQDGDVNVADVVGLIKWL